jgi:predicted ATPase
VAKTILPRLEDISIDRTSNKELFLSIKENGGNFSNRLISEGTLRVLGLVAVMSPTTGSTVIGYEEPENGVHPRRLNAIAELLLNVHSEDRQVLVNTHSPILPTYFKNDFLMICRREHGQTVFDPFNSLGPLYKSGEIDAHLNDRIERGDFGG